MITHTNSCDKIEDTCLNPDIDPQEASPRIRRDVIIIEDYATMYAIREYHYNRLMMSTHGLMVGDVVKNH